MKKKRQWELRLQRHLQKWLIPRSEAGVITMSVALEGVDEMIADLDRLEKHLDTLAQKAGAVCDAMDAIGGRHELER